MASLDRGEESKKREHTASFEERMASFDPGEEDAFLEDPTVFYDSGEERKDDQESETDLMEEEQETQLDLMEEEARTDSSEEAEKKRKWEREDGWLKNLFQRIEFEDEWFRGCFPEEAHKFKKDFTDSEGFDVDDGCPAIGKFYRLHPSYDYDLAEHRKQRTIVQHCAIKAVGRHNRRTRDKLEFDELVKVNMMISEDEDEGVLYFITIRAYPEGQKEMAKEYQTRVRYVGSPKHSRADVHSFMPKPPKPGAEAGKPEPASEAGKTEEEKRLEERESGWRDWRFEIIVPKIVFKDENCSPESWERARKYKKAFVDSEGFDVYGGCPFLGSGFYSIYPWYEYDPELLQAEKNSAKRCAKEAVCAHNCRTHDNLEFDGLVRVNMLISESVYYFITLRAHRKGEKEETKSKKYRTRVMYSVEGRIVQSFMPKPPEPGADEGRGLNEEKSATASIY